MSASQQQAALQARPARPGGCAAGNDAGCCCQERVSLAAVAEKRKFNPEQRREILVLAFSLFIYGLTMIFEGRLEAARGFPLLMLCYAVPYFMCGAPVFKSAVRGWRRGDYLNEFSLMGLATLAAILLGHLAEAVGVMLFYSIGEFLQELAAENSRGSIRALLASRPSTANLLENGQVRLAAVEDVPPGSRLVVRAGEKFPLDGVVRSGSAQVDTSPLTGEALPRRVRPGDPVNAGCINLDGVLEMESSGRFADTHMARILEMVENAAARKSPTERFITRFARYYTPLVVTAAVLLAALPPLFFGGQWSDWGYRALVLLIISCPCALLVSIPLSYFGGIGLASRQGILVKGGNVLDGILKTGSVVFDKTGTLTRGGFEVTALTPAAGVSREDLLRAAALAECESNHPIARSILRAVPDFTRPAGLEAAEVSGCGMRAESGGVVYLAGRNALLERAGLAVPEVEAAGSVVHVARGGQYLGHILVEDSLKPDAAPAVAALKRRGLRTAILSGDRAAAVAKAAAELGVDSYQAGLFPGDKVAALSRIDRPENIAFVGDGINDAPSLAVSRVGIAMGRLGSEAAIEAADAVILNDSPLKVAELYSIARRVKAVVWQNICLALGIKGLVMGFGIAGLSGLWEAVFADVGVALLAVLNVVRALRRG